MPPTIRQSQSRGAASPWKRGSRALMTVLIGLTTCGSVVGGLTAVAAHAESCPNQTLRNGPSEALPDCRAYEQVSPANKDGNDAVSPLPFSQFPAQAASAGDGVVYMSDGTFPTARGSLFPNAHLSTRGEGNEGWHTSEATPPSLVATPSNGLSAGTVGYNFSEDLSQSVIKADTPPRAPSGEQLYNLFLDHNGSSSLVNTAAPSEFAPQGEECYEFAECYDFFDLTAFAGASSTFDRVLFEANASLVGTGAPGGFVENLYESSAGQVRPVGVLPDGAIAPGAQPGAGGGSPIYTTAIASGRWSDVSHAISADGSRIIWRDPSTGNLYVREDNSQPDAKTVLIAEGGQFWAASTDGSIVYYTKAGDLYRYELAGETKPAATTDLTPGGEVRGVAGVSEDGSYVYVVATGQLVNGKGTGGQPNLYVWHEDANTHASELKFITTLAEGDSADWTSTPANLRAYVTPDGRHLAFSSLNRLTSYDNHASSEVYEYSSENSALVCASCDPSGAPPVGSAFTGANLTQLASTAFYQPRVLSDDGARLFFSSPDPLLPGNATASTKVYEYEQPGTGSCKGELGCVYRISSGSSGAGGMADIFLDADATGSNVFFATASQLAPSDVDNLYDVYDARVGGGVPAPSGSSDCSSGCSGEGITSPPGSTAPGSQQVLGAVAAPPGKTTSLLKPGKKAKPLTCQAKAKKLASRKARARALKRCPKPRHQRTSHGRAR